MLTPTEKVIFNSVLFLLFTLLVTASTMYLPNHILTICNRVWYYANGESIADSIDSARNGGALHGTVATADAMRRKLGEL